MDKTLIEQTLAAEGSIRKTARALNTSFTNLRYWIAKHDVAVLERRLENKTERLCPRCKSVKPRCEFYRRQGIDGASSYCKPCTTGETIGRQRAFKRLCVEYKGSCCVRCSYNQCLGALEFHHRDPTQKDFHIAGLKGYTMSQTVKDELDKCDLVCANCHRELHEQMNRDEDGAPGGILTHTKSRSKRE